MKLFVVIDEALLERAQLVPALHIRTVPIRWYRRGSCLVHGFFLFDVKMILILDISFLHVL